MIKVKQKYEGYIVYFKFFASEKYPDCFWYTKTNDNFAFELGRINDYTPLNTTWQEIRKNEKKY